jgi:hypothetical protein
MAIHSPKTSIRRIDFLSSGVLAEGFPSERFGRDQFADQPTGTPTMLDEG